MKSKISVIITAAGAPQAATLVRQLKENTDHPVRVVGIDMDKEAVGRFVCDAFHTIPRAGGAGYRERILEIVAEEKADAFLNCGSADVVHISRMRRDLEALGCRVICSDPEVIDIVNNKYRFYKLFEDNPIVRVPKFCHPRSLQEFVEMAHAMGYPRRDLCFKPHVSQGTRGFRVLSGSFDRRHVLLNEKPTARYMTLDEFVSIFEPHADFPDLLLMELVAGDEYDVMALGYEGKSLLTTVKTRESHRWGVINRAEIVDRPEIVRQIDEIARVVRFSYCAMIQFIDGYVIELNPRTSTFIFDKGFNEPWLAIKLALNLATPDEVASYTKKIPYGRRLVRYMDQLSHSPNGEWSF